MKQIGCRCLVLTVLAIGFLSLSLQGVWAADALITAKDPEIILNLVKGYGSGDLGTDSEGDPRIQGRIGGTKYVVLFYGCKDGKACQDIQFVASWSDTNVTQEDVNNWNRTTRFGKAYLDKDNDPTLELIVNLNYGVSKKNLDDTIDWWAMVMKKFEKEVVNDQ